MSETLTEGVTGAAASITEPTAQAPVTQPTAESQNQEAISGGQTQETAAATATNQNNSGSQADDSLAKFAKSQGIEDMSGLSEREVKLLKIASDNQKAYRHANQSKIEDVSKELGSPSDDATDVQKLAAKVQAFEYKSKTDSFWSQEGKNRELEASMVQILKDKQEQFGKDYAYSLSQDLDTLYAMAQLQNGTGNPTVAKEEGRREERVSINKSLSAGAPQAHAINTQPQSPAQVTPEWIMNEYNPSNPEHRKLVDAIIQK